MQLLIGNRNYSSWSMRPWVLMRAFDLPFATRMVRFDGFEPDSAFKRTLAAFDCAGKVPVLVDQALVIWESLAIVEYLAERFPDRPVWPVDPMQRARARSLCAEMHAGFAALRGACPMNIEARLPEVGARVLREVAGVADDLARIDHLWQMCLERSGGPMLFGAFCAADAFFAPVVMRIRTYALPLSEKSQAWATRLEAVPAVAAWIADAVTEKDFRSFEEPYRRAP